MSRKPEYGSDLIVDLLKACKIEYAALNPGSSFRGLHDSLVNYGGNQSPEAILCCHEEVAVTMAYGYAKMAGKPMAAIVHDIVGLQHATMSIFNAWTSRVPVIVMGGTGPMDTTKRRPGIDWVHTAFVQGEQVRQYAKWDDQPTSIGGIPESFIRAYRLATREPCGPVYLCYDTEIQETPLPDRFAPLDVNDYPPALPLQAPEEGFEKTLSCLLEAEWPVIVADWVGRTRAGFDALVELAELLAIPVLDRSGRLNFPSQHPLNLTGLEKSVLVRADLVLSLDVPDLFSVISERTEQDADRTSVSILRSDCKVIHVDLKDLLTRSWVQDYDKLTKSTVSIHAETGIFLPELVRRLRNERGILDKKTPLMEQRRAELGKLRAEFMERLAAEAQNKAAEKPISSLRLAADLAEVLRDEDYVLSHASPTFVERHFLHLTNFNQYIGARRYGGVGLGFPSSMGAALALKGSGKICVGIQSDGDFLFNPSGLWTLAHYEIPLLMIVFNNRSYYNDETHQRIMAVERNRPVENSSVGIRIEQPNVNFTRLAESYEVRGIGPINEPAELQPALRDAVRTLKETGHSVLVEVVMQNR